MKNLIGIFAFVDATNALLYFKFAINLLKFHLLLVHYVLKNLFQNFHLIYQKFKKMNYVFRVIFHYISKIVKGILKMLINTNIFIVWNAGINDLFFSYILKRI